MPRVELNAYNYYPDFKNSSLVNRANNIIKEICDKNVEGFENFGFHELAMNFSDYNNDELSDYVKEIIKNNIKDVIVFASNRIIESFNAANKFLFENDLLKDQRINIHIVNVEDELDNVVYQVEKLYEKIVSKKSSIIFTGLSKYEDNIVELIKWIANILQQKWGYYRALENIFILSKESLEKQLSFLKIPEKNRLILPNILNPLYSFFSEINLVLLMLKGAKIDALLEGYSEGARNWINKDISANYAFQYGFIRYMQKSDRNFNVLISSERIFDGVVNLMKSINNTLLMKNNIFTTAIYFPNDVYSYGQSFIENHKKYYLTYFQVGKEKVDYRLSDELNVYDGLKDFGLNRISEFKKLENDSLINTLSDVANCSIAKIQVEDNSEVSLGCLISFIYWSIIFECYLDKQIPFV